MNAKSVSTPAPASGRKGTLDGLSPSPGLSRGHPFGYPEPAEEDFDAERTMVVDPDDAPTADYDPRTHAQSLDPRRVISAPPLATAPAPPPSSMEDDPRARSQDLVQPLIPAAPQTPSFGDLAPAPRPSDAGRRRTSRRTVRIPDDPTFRKNEGARPASADGGPPEASAPEPPTVPFPSSDNRQGRPVGGSLEERTVPMTEPLAAARTIPQPTPSQLMASEPTAVDNVDHVLAETHGLEPATSAAAAPGEARFGVPDLSDFGPEEDITVVKALRIISIGSDPPPPFTSAFATWPPPRSAPDDALDSGWTPAAPAVAFNDAAATTPREILGITRPSDAPSIQLDSRPPTDLDGVEMQERISEIPLSERDEILEDIEPDAVSFVQPEALAKPEARPASEPAPDQKEAPPAAPKRPPPPPPKTKAESKAEAKPAAAQDAANATTDAPPKGKPWWEDIFSDEYIRTMDRLEDRVIHREVDFIEESLGMEKHAVVLDLACGMGDHAVELAARGYSVVGLDYSRGMLKIAESKVKTRVKLAPSYSPPSFVQADMRELAYEEAFDGVYCWSTSFGYFDEEKNLAVLQRVHRALRQGGMFLLEVINRDYVAPRSPSLVWFEGQSCVCMDDMYVDFFTSRMRVKRTAMFEGGLSRELDYSIRLYTLHELGNMLHQVGFKVIEVTGHPAHPGVFFGTESPRLIILSERS